MPSNNVFQYSKIRTRNEVRRKALKPEKKWNPALFGIRNPVCWNPESITRNPESTAWNPESKTVLDFLTWGDLYHGGGMTLRVHPRFKEPQTFSANRSGAMFNVCKRLVPVLCRIAVNMIPWESIICRHKNYLIFSVFPWRRQNSNQETIDSSEFLLSWGITSDFL